MLRHALRRILWTLPALAGVSILTFLFLSFVPDPAMMPAAATGRTADEHEHMRRARFLDLPRFVNLEPRDARARALEAAAAIAEGRPDAQQAAAELARLGGAALPHVLPMLEALPPAPRTSVALALAPVAERMGLPERAAAADAARAVAFWTRFWDDRGVELREASVRSAVRRVVRYRSWTRAQELRELDTFALPLVMEALEAPADAVSFDRARRLVEVAADVTKREDRIAPGDDLAAARACVERWRAFWYVYGSDYVTLGGPGRVAAAVTETRYGKWALSAVTRRLGIGSSGEPVLDELVRRAPVTLLLVFGAIALAYAAAVPLGIVSAASRGRKTDLAIASVVLAVHAVPTAVLAVAAAVLAGRPAERLVVPTAVLALGLVAAPTRHQRSALAATLAQDYVRAAHARGASRLRAIVVHGLRNALLPVVTLATLEAPMALGGAFVVERVFGLDGLGEATIRAVEARDTSFLMAVSIASAGAAALAVIATDLAHGLIDPRLAPALWSRKGAS